MDRGREGQFLCVVVAPHAHTYARKHPPIHSDTPHPPPTPPTYPQPQLSQSTAADVQDLVNVGVVAYLTQLLETGRFHADPHPGNLIRTPEGKLCILDFGLQCEVRLGWGFGL